MKRSLSTTGLACTIQAMLPASPNENFLSKNLRFNFIIGIFDGGFFGFALGFASFITVIPLFVNQLTDSALLIGLVPAIHNVGWQLPQLLTAGWVSRARRYKPLVVWMTAHERIPFVGLALIAWFLPAFGSRGALILIFLMLTWQGLGGGFTANAWQNMIAKVIPDRLHGTFYGSQAAAFNGLAGISAIAAGLLLERLASPLDFTACFLAASAAMAVSYVFIAQTREPESPKRLPKPDNAFWGEALAILKRDRNFCAFLVVRAVSQFASMAFAFYTVYLVNEMGVGEAAIGALTGFLLIVQVLFNPLVGRLGDRWGHRNAMLFGALAAVSGTLLAATAKSPGWFYLVFLLEGAALVAIWVAPMSLTVRFARGEEDRPVYIGLSNSLTAPAAILAPLLGGWLADTSGFQTTFMVSALFAVLMSVMLFASVKDPGTAS
ncbi:MAG: MFS transporter [Chloroflexota bacterium]